MAVDALRRLIKKGDHLAIARRSGSSLWLSVMRVEKIEGAVVEGPLLKTSYNYGGHTLAVRLNETTKSMKEYNRIILASPEEHF